jgi:hypothetical protein
MVVQRCERCEFGIAKEGDKYTFAVPARNLIDRLEKKDTLRVAYETGICPICETKMTAEKTAKAG